jgi:tail tape-measure protein
MIVGGATVEVNADLAKLQAGLEKAKAATTAYVGQASKHFVAMGAAATAAGVGIAGIAGKLTPTNDQLKALGENTKSVTAGLTAMVSTLARVGVAVASFAARSPVAGTILATTLLGGSPALAAATLVAGTERGRSLARGAMTAGRFALGNPLTSLAIGGVGLAAVGVAAKLGKEGFDALKESFQETRKSSAELKENLEELKKAAEKLSTEMPKGNALTDATLRRLNGITGGLTSPFAQLSAGKLSSDVIEDADDAIEELTLRFGDQERAAQTLAVALAEPAKGWRLLRDAGFAFSREQVRLFEGARTMEERLEAQSELLDALNKQVKSAKQSGFIEFMDKLGTFLGKAPQAAGSAFTGLVAAIGAGIAQVTGITYAVNKLDEAFRKLGEAMERTNKAFFPSNAREELEGINGQIENIERALNRLNKGAAGLGGLGGIINSLTGGGVESMAGDQLRRRRQELERDRLGAVNREAERLAVEEMARLVAQDDKLRDRLKDLQMEGELLRANNRASLEARRIAAAEGVDPSDKRIKAIQAQIQANEDRRRAISQAGQLSVFDRENQQLTQQLQLFRFGNEEMQQRQRLLQIELQAAQRRQPLNEQQKNALLEQITLLQRVQDLTKVANDSAQAVFGSMADALANFATTGKFKMKELADSIIGQLIRIAMQAFVMKPLLNAISGFTNTAIAGSLAPGSTTSTITVPRAGSFASGGSFDVPAGGSGDKPFLIGLSAGERVDVTPAGKGRSSGGVTVINNVNSSREFEIKQTEREGPDGSKIIEQTFSEVMRRIGRGEGDSTFGARYGVRPRTLQR